MKKVIKKLKQSLSILLAVAMVVTCVPQTATLAFAASNTDITDDIDAEDSTDAVTPDDSEEPANASVPVSDDENDAPADETEQSGMVVNYATGDEEVESTEGEQELDSVENEQNLGDAQVTPFEFTGTVGDSGDVTFADNSNVTINDAEDSKGLASTSGSEAYYFQAKANSGFSITKVTATATATAESGEEAKTATLSTDATEESKKITSEEVTGEGSDGFTKYTIPLTSEALGSDVTFATLEKLEITIEAKEDNVTTSYTVTVTENANATVEIKSGANKGEGEDTGYTTDGTEDIVFTVTAAEGNKVTGVTVAVGDNSVTPAQANGEYTIAQADITGNVTITVTTAAIQKYDVTVKDYTVNATGNSYEVYSVTKTEGEDGTVTYTKGDASNKWGNVEEDTEVYFAVAAADMYTVKNVEGEGVVRVGRLEDGTNVYRVTVTKAVEITVTTQLDEKNAYSASFVTAESADNQYKITTNGTDDDTTIRGKAVRTALKSIELTITPNTGYKVDKVEKVTGEGEEATKTAVTNTADEGAETFKFTQEFSETEKAVKYEVTVTAKALDGDGGKIVFDNGAENLTLEVNTSEESKVEAVDGEENTYQVKSGAQYVEFELTSNNVKIVPVVTIGGNEWYSLNDESPYKYKVSASLFTEESTTVKIAQTAVTKVLTVISNAEQIDLERLLAIEDSDGGQKYNNTGLSWGEFDGIAYNDYVEFEIPVDTNIILNVNAKEDYKIESYKIGLADAQNVDGETAEIKLALVDNTTVVINPVSAPAPYVVNLSLDNVKVEGKDNVYPVEYNKTYVAAVSKKGESCTATKAVIEPQGVTSTAATADGNTAITVAPEDAGKDLTVKIWVGEDDVAGDPSVTLTLKVSKAITNATITGVKSNKLTQTVDTEQAYEIKVTPADANVNNLVADVKWAEGTQDAEKSAFTASVVDGKLVITTAVAKDADAVTALNAAAQKATIRLVDKTKVEGVNYADAASVTGSEFKLTIAGPTGLTGATPTVVLKSSDDISLKLTLGVPANKIVEPNKGNLWYEVKVTPQGTPTADDKIKAAATYYFAKNPDANTQDETIVVSDADFGFGKAWKFDVAVKAVQTLNDFDLNPETKGEDYETNKAAAIAFESKVKALTPATKDPYFATKLTLKKGTTNVYTGMENIKIATIDFGKLTTYTDVKDYLGVQDITGGSSNSIINNLYVDDGNVYLSLPLSSNGSYSSVALGKHTIRVTAKSPDMTWAAYADLVVTVNRGIEYLSLNAATGQIYKETNKAATLKVTPVYNNGNTSAAYAAKTKKVKDYVLVQAEEKEITYGEYKYTDFVPKKDDEGNDILLTNSNLTVKNGTVTVAKGFDLAAAKANGTDKFYVRATSADWTDKASGTSSSVYGYSRLITITEDKIKLGEVAIVKYDDTKYGYVSVLDAQKKATSGDFGYTVNEYGYSYYTAQVVVLKEGAKPNENGVYQYSDFVDASNLTFKSSNAKALGISSSGWITAVKAGKNIKITVTANDGGKATAVLDKIEIENAKPAELGLKVEEVGKYGYNAINNDYADLNVEFTGTTNSVLQLTVMRRDSEDGPWYTLDEVTDLKVTISKAKVLNKVSEFNQAYTVNANTAAATVKLVYTGAGGKVTKEFKINNKGVVTAAAPKLKASGNLAANYHNGAQTITYTLSGYDYEGKVVMVNTDAADSNNAKNSYRYSYLEGISNLNEVTPINEDGTFALYFEYIYRNEQNNYEEHYTSIPAGNYKLSFTFGTLAADGSIIPDAKPVNMTLKAVAPAKASYKPVTTVKMSVYDTAAGKVLAGTGKGFVSDSYYNLLNANITGQANHFRDLFELNGNVLKLKSEFSSELKAALKKAGEIAEETDAAVIEYITASKSKAAKNDRIGYASYYAVDANGVWVANGQTKITVTFDTKKSTDTYTLTNTTILQGTKNASVQVLKNKKAGAVIADAYVDGDSDKGGKFVASVAGLNGDFISFTLDDDTAGAANKHKVTVYVVPENNYYKSVIAAAKTAWETAKNTEGADVTAEKTAYENAIKAHGVPVTTTITVGAKDKTGNKISVAKNNLKPAFTGGYYYVEGGLEAGYDGKHGNYWIHVPYTKNMACEIASIDSNDTKLAAARENGSKNLVFFDPEVQNYDKNRDDFGKDYINIRLSKEDLQKAVEAKTVKYNNKGVATLSVKATVHFGERNSETGEWENVANYKTETISFTLTLPDPFTERASDYAEAVDAVEKAKEAIEEASVASWVWNGEGLPLPEAKDGVITLSSANGEPFYKLNELIGNVREQVEKIAPSDTGVLIRMPQECVKVEGVDTMTLQATDFTAPTEEEVGTFKVRAELYDASTCNENNEPILEGDNKSTVTPVEFTLSFNLKEKPADVEAAINKFIADKGNDPDYISSLGENGQSVIERDARIAAGLVKADGITPTNSLRLYVSDYEYVPAGIGSEKTGSISGWINVYGYLYGGDEISVHFSFTIPGLDSLSETVTKVDNAVKALTATNNTTKAEILEAANEAIKNPQFSAVWQKAGDDTLKDDKDKDDEGNSKPVSDADGEVYKLTKATREATGYVIGTIVIVDSEDDTVAEGNTVSVNLEIAKLASSTEAVNKVKAVVGFKADSENSGNYVVDADAIKAIVLGNGNSEATVKEGILKAANKAVNNDGYTVDYKKDAADDTKVEFEFTPAKYKATAAQEGQEGEEGIAADPGTGKISFKLVITDDQAGADAEAIPDVEMPEETFGPFAELQTLADAKADVTAALDAYKKTITTGTIGNAVEASTIEAVLNPTEEGSAPIVTGTGLTVAVKDFDKAVATVKAKGSITCKVVITKTVEDADDETETIDFEVEIPKVEQTLADAKSAVEGALNAMANDRFTNDDIETVDVPATEGGEATKKDVVKKASLDAVIAEVEKVIDTESFEVKLSEADGEYVVEKATIKKEGKVKITLTITEKTTSGEEPSTQAEGDPSREWTIAKLGQSPEAAKTAAEEAIAKYIADTYADGIDETNAESLDTTVANNIKTAIEAVVNTDEYTVEARYDNDKKAFTKKEAEGENPACYEATFLLKYTDGEGESAEDKEIELKVKINAKAETTNPEGSDNADAGTNSASSVSANDSVR